MPSTSCAQAKLMAAAAHNPDIAKKRGIPQDVAKDFNKADAASGYLKKCSEMNTFKEFLAREKYKK